jgi:hypothetical protein
MKHMRYILYRKIFAGIIIVFLLFSAMGKVAYGDPTKLENRSDELSSSLPNATVQHLISFTITDNSQPLGSIEFQFCQEDPIPDFPCTSPVGFNANSVALLSQSGNTGFSVASNSTSNSIILTRSPATPTTGANTYELGSIVNPSSQDTFYLRLYVFPTTDASGTETQNGGVALATNNAVTVSAEVPPYLNFCTGITIVNQDCSTASGYSINFGNLSDLQPRSGSSQFTAGTNAQSGYTVTVNGPTLTSGNNVIPSMGSPAPSLNGTSQFGINLRANATPPVGTDPVGSGFGAITNAYDQANRFSYSDGATLVSSPSNTENQTFTISYMTNVSKDQAAGVYVTTLTFICLANF